MHIHVFKLINFLHFCHANLYLSSFYMLQIGVGAGNQLPTPNGGNKSTILQSPAIGPTLNSMPVLGSNNPAIGRLLSSVSICIHICVDTKQKSR